MDSDEDTLAPVGWKWPSLLTATLFLNFVFWHAPAQAFPFEGPPIVFVSSIGAVGALVVALFFLGPACATQESGRSLFEVAEASFGT